MSYRIFETDGFLADLKQDFEGRQEKITKKLVDYVYPQLAASPGYGPHIRKLKGYQPETWRFRIGAYRFFYQIDETQRIVFLIAADHRKESYR